VRNVCCGIYFRVLFFRIEIKNRSTLFFCFRLHLVRKLEVHVDTLLIEPGHGFGKIRGLVVIRNRLSDFPSGLMDLGQSLKAVNLSGIFRQQSVCSGSASSNLFSSIRPITLLGSLSSPDLFIFPHAWQYKCHILGVASLIFNFRGDAEGRASASH
jgi:hypothetical protein